MSVINIFSSTVKFDSTPDFLFRRKKSCPEAALDTLLVETAGIEPANSTIVWAS